MIMIFETSSNTILVPRPGLWYSDCMQAKYILLH